MKRIIKKKAKKKVKKQEVAMRFNKGKSKWSYVHFASIIPMIDVLEFGANKYSANNWMKGLDMKEILESQMRHLTALMDGQELDPESGLPHQGHIMCNSMFYNYFDKLNKSKNEKNEL